MNFLNYKLIINSYTAMQTKGQFSTIKEQIKDGVMRRRTAMKFTRPEETKK